MVNKYYITAVLCHRNSSSSILIDAHFIQSTCILYRSDLVLGWLDLLGAYEFMTSINTYKIICLIRKIILLKCSIFRFCYYSQCRLGVVPVCFWVDRCWALLNSYIFWRGRRTTTGARHRPPQFLHPNRTRNANTHVEQSWTLGRSTKLGRITRDKLIIFRVICRF